MYQLRVTGASECTFSTPCTVIALLSTSDANYDPQLYVRGPQSCEDPSGQITHSDEIGGGVGEIMEWCVFNNEDFWIFVDGSSRVGVNVRPKSVASESSEDASRSSRASTTICPGMSQLVSPRSDGVDKNPSVAMATGS